MSKERGTNPEGPILPSYQLFMSPPRVILHHEDAWGGAQADYEEHMLTAEETEAMDKASELVWEAA